MPQKSFILIFSHIYLKGIDLIGSKTVYAQKGHRYHLNWISCPTLGTNMISEGKVTLSIDGPSKPLGNSCAYSFQIKLAQNELHQYTQTLLQTD